MTEEEISPEILDSVEKRLEDLRNQFEQHFMGNRKVAPIQERTSVQYLIRRLSNYSSSNTRLRFRFQQIVSKFNSYNQYWNRTLQQIEAGTYFRSRFKAKLKAGAFDDPDSVHAQKKAAAPKKKAGGGIEDHIDQVHQEFVSAKKSLNQASNVSRDKIAQAIKKQMPALKERYKGKDVKFKVVVEGGKAKLKATVK